MALATPSEFTSTVALSIRTKYLLVACAIAVSTALLVAGVNYYWIERLTLERAVGELHVKAELIAPHIRDGYERMRHDAIAISQMPPFQGLLNSMRNGDLDPNDGSTSAQWRQRLQTIFTSMLQYRPAYMQMRYVGVADGGMELVRVERRGDEILHLEGGALQRKGDEPYFRDSLNLPPGRVHFSAITPNRDFGEIRYDLPMLRTVAPVHDKNGTLFGFMVINAHYGVLLQQALRETSPQEQLYLVNDTGDFISRSVDGALSPLVMSSDQSAGPRPAVVDAVLKMNGAAGTLERDIDGQQMIISVAKLEFDTYNKDRFVNIVLVATRDNVLADAYATRRWAIWVSGLMILVSSALAFAVSGWLTRPLLRVFAGIQGYQMGGGKLNLPTERRDEIGDVSRAFSGLVARLEHARETQQTMLARLEAIVNYTVDALITIETDGTIISFNKGAVRIFGYSANEAIGKNIKILMPESVAKQHDGYLSAYRKTGRKNFIGNIRELNALTKDGRFVPVELLVSEIHIGKGTSNAGTLYSGIIRDISERKRLEQEVLAQAEALRRSNSELEEFAYIASHDLKEPLRAIHNHVQFLEEDHAEVLGDDGRRRIERLKQLCVLSDKLVSELLQFSRLARADLSIQPIDMNDVVQKLRTELADTLAESNAEIQVATPLPQVTGDISRISSLLRNLIVNGIKYNDQPHKRIEIGFRNDCPCGEHRRDAYYVKDNGIGIAPEFSDRVFKMFKRLNSEKRFGPGTGAGLSFAKKIVERHGGTLWLESEPDLGTTFFFNLAETTR